MTSLENVLAKLQNTGPLLIIRQMSWLCSFGLFAPLSSTAEPNKPGNKIYTIM